MIGFWSEEKNRTWLQVTAETVAGALLFSIIAPPFSLASIWQDRQKALNSQRQQQRSAPERAFLPGHSSVALEFEGASSGLQIPEELGSVVETWGGNESLAGKSSSLPTVIQIEDAHGVYEAQKNSANILRLIQSERGDAPETETQEPLLVCVEGAWGRVSPEWVSVFPDESAKKDTAESLLQQGEINSEEYLSILS